MSADGRATDVGDVLTVVIFQAAESSNLATNSSRKATDLSGSISGGHLSESGELSFGGGDSGRGEVKRSEKLIAQITLTVQGGMPNGDPLIAGEQVLKGNGERTRIWVRGPVRTAATSAGKIRRRHVAVVIVTARLPASANVGDKIDANVSSIGDARSLAGGTLLMTPLLGPNSQPYALAQGALITGGHSFENDLNSQQRNYPTSAMLQGGASIERAVDATILGQNGVVTFLLNDPSFATSRRIADAINTRFGGRIAEARSADEVRISYGGGRGDLTAFAADVQSILVEPERRARVVINQRTRTIVAGGDVMISSVVISQGDIPVTVN